MKKPSRRRRYDEMVKADPHQAAGRRGVQHFRARACRTTCTRRSRDKRGEEDSREAFAKRLRRGVQQKKEESEEKTEMDVADIVNEINAVLEGTLDDETVATKSL